MPKFSSGSLDKLETCHQDLQTLFTYVIKHFDCTIIYGHRSVAKQFSLFKQGRKEVNGIWIIENPLEVVTYKDGITKKGKHNFTPSDAIDVIPYPIEWNNYERIRYFNGYVMGIAKMLKEYGAIENNIRGGFDWDQDTILKDQSFNDLAHYEISYKL